MKQLILILIVSMLGFAACDSTEKETEETQKMDSIEHLYETKWVVTELNGQAVVQTNEEREVPHIVMRKEENKTMGSGGCNRFTGSFKLDGSEIGFSRVAATKMFCEDVMQNEEIFFTTLQQVTSYELSTDSLILMNEEREAVIRLQAD